MSFKEFLFDIGMFYNKKKYEEMTDQDVKVAKERYINALSSGIQGNAEIFLKRDVKDIFMNGYNIDLMIIHEANHDIQIVIDPYAATQYVTKYITKNEAGTSALLKAIDEDPNHSNQMEKLNALANALDKNREVSIQEATYRILGLPMTKFSVAIKYLSTVHPDFRDGLLKSNIEELEEDESMFYNSPHDYYESRPEESNEAHVHYDYEELDEDYWHNISLSEFWSKYDIVYQKQPKMTGNIITLKNGNFIRRRNKNAILRYYLSYSNDEDLARGLLILFYPFRNESADIHSKDVKELLDENRDVIESKRSKFEKYKMMTELIDEIKGNVDNDENDDEDEQEDLEMETTSVKDIEEFNAWAKSEASKDLKYFKNFTNLCDMKSLRSSISTLNHQQRKLFDDFIERIVSTDIDENPCYLFIAGEAGTGKSHLLKVLIEAIKIVKLNPEQI